MSQNISKESLQQEEKIEGLFLKNKEFKYRNSSMILAKRRLSEPKNNKITFQNIYFRVNDLGLALYNNVSTIKTIPKKNEFELSNNYKKEKISDLKGYNIEIKDINSTIKSIGNQNIKKENNINNNLSSNKYLNQKNLQKEIRCQINNDDYISNKLFEGLIFLIKEYLIISKFNDSLFLTKDDFEIFEKMEHSKIVLIMNLSNIINVINQIYSITKDNTNDFISSLNKIKIKFS